ncbi:MAG: DUF2085 domain-containing protein [Acidobacteriota bacterium]
MTTGQVSPHVRQFILLVDRITIAISRHWLVLASMLLFVFITLPLLAPVLMANGYTGPAQIIYTAYRFTCHELAYRTFFISGAQPVYSLEQLRASLNVHDEDFFFWSNFPGNSQLGYKMAWCERDAAIYTSIFIGGLIFGLLRSRVRRLDWRIYLLLVVPMAVDGFWQLFTSPVVLLPFLPAHESDWLLRTITGTLFGLASVWLIYPYIEAAMRDIYSQARGQFQRAMEYESGLSVPPARRNRL